MRVLRKMTVWFLILALVFSASGAMAAEETETAAAPEKYLKQIDMLSGLHIYRFKDSDYRSTVTRAAFACMVMDLLGFEEGTVEKLPFSDVTYETEYLGAIDFVSACGFMNGVGDGKFCPENSITYIQAVKTLVSVLGYKPVADVSGGYEQGYLKWAREAKITKGAPADINLPLTYEMAAQLILLTADADVMDVISVSGDKIKYSILSGQNLLSVYHKIYYDRGTMTDNGVSAVKSKSRVGQGCVIIGSRTLTGATEKDRRLIGQTVDYYYKDEDSQYKLVYAVASSGVNDVVMLKADQLLKDHSKFSKNCIVADVDGREERYNIDPYANLLYNGSLDETFTKETMKISEGEITLIDSDKDNDYELVCVEECVDVLVTEHSTDLKRIIAQKAKEGYNSIDYGKYDCVVFEDADGEAVEPSEVISNTVLSVFRSKDNTKIRFVASNVSEEISVTSVCETDDNITVYYDDDKKGAVLTDSYVNLLRTKPAVYQSPVAGNYYQAFFNYTGKIVMMREITAPKQYAYLLGLGRGSGLNAKDVLLKLYLETNQIAVVSVSKQFSINQEEGKTGEDLFNNTTIYNGGKVIPQLVLVQINAKGELTSIEIDNEVDNSLYGFDLKHFSLDYYSGNSLFDPRKGKSARSMYGKQCVTSSTKIFLIRNWEHTLEVTDETKVLVISYDEYQNNIGAAYTKLYDADETWNAGAIVVAERSNSLRDYNFYVLNSSVILDQNGEEKMSITGYMEGTVRVYTERDEGVISAAVKRRFPGSDGYPKTGDVMKIGFDYSGRITCASMVYSPQMDNNPDYCFVDLTNGTIENGRNIYQLGYICAVSDGRISIFSQANDNYLPIDKFDRYYTEPTQTQETFWVNLLTSGASVIHFDCNTGVLKKATSSDIVASAQVTDNGFDCFDKSTKILVRRYEGVTGDVFFVTGLDKNY